MTIEEINKKVEELEKRASEIENLDAEKREARKNAEKREANFYGDSKMENAEKRNKIAAAFVENRAAEGLAINSTGMDFYASVVEAFRKEKTLSGLVSYIKGSYTGFKVPMISARPAVQVSSTEGDDALTVDSTMTIGVKSITPELFYSILGITYQTEKFSTVTDAEIVSAFVESFGEAIETALQSKNAGASYAIAGLMSKDTSVVAAANRTTLAGDITWADLYTLAGKAKGKTGNWTIVVPSAIMGSLLSASNEGDEFMKEEYARTGAIRGVKVVEIAVDPSTTAGDTLATLIDLSKNYKLCIASEDVMLRAVFDKNSLNKYLQGAMGVGGAVVMPAEVYQLAHK